MFDAFQKSYFADGSRGNAIVVPINSYFLHRHYLLRQTVCGFEDYSISAFTEFLSEIVLAQLVFVFAETILLRCLPLGVMRLLLYHLSFAGVSSLIFEL